MRFLVILHGMGVILAVLIALGEIESIISSGPILSASGLLLAVLAFCMRRPLTLYYALGTPSVSLFCFAIIYGLHWDPDQARFPIGVLVAVFSFINTVLGVAAWFELKSPPKKKRRQGPFQFSIAAIMGLTLVVALSLSLIRTFGDLGIALAMVLCHLSLLAYLLKRYHQEGPFPGTIKISHSARYPRTSDDDG